MKPKRRLQREQALGRAEYAVIDPRAVLVTAPHREDDEGQEGIVDLAASIARHGLIQPIVVRKSPQQGQYILVCGARRLRACRMAGMAAIPALVREADEQEAVACWLEEHMTRLAPCFLTETDMIRRAGAEGVRRRFALPQALLDARLRMLLLPDAVAEEVRKQGLVLEQAQPLLEIRDEGKQMEAARIIAQRGLGARQARRLVCGPQEDGLARRNSMSAAVSAIHETVQRIRIRGYDAQVGMHSQEDGVCVQIYLKNLRCLCRSAGNRDESAN